MSTHADRLHEAEWDEFIRLNRKSSLLSVGLAALIVAFHDGLVFQRPGFFELVAGISVIYFGVIRYLLARGLSVPRRRQKALAGFFYVITFGQAVSWAALVSVLTPWSESGAQPIILGILIMAGIGSAAQSSMHLRPWLFGAFLLGFYGGTLGYFWYVGGHKVHPYLIPTAGLFTFYLWVSARTQKKVRVELLKAQTHALSQNDAFAEILDDAPMLFAHLNSSGRFQFVNKHFEELYGVKDADLRGVSVQRVLEQDVSLDPLRDFVKSSKSHDARELVVKRDERENKYWFVQQRSRDNEHILFYWMDLGPYESSKNSETVKEHKAVEEKKIQVLGEFAEHLFHELNKPLAQIWGYSRRLEQSPDAQKMEAPLSKLVNLAKALRSMSSLKAGEPVMESKTFKLSELVDPSVAAVKPRFDELKISLEVVNPEAGTFVLGGLVWLQQIVENLLLNAADALEGQENPSVKIEVTRTPEGVEIWVKDSGPVLDPSMQQKIFEPFFTTKAPGEGMGMGLSLSRELATRMGAHLVFKETLEHTNGFALSLKGLVAEALAASPDKPADEASAATEDAPAAQAPADTEAQAPAPSVPEEDPKKAA